MAWRTWFTIGPRDRDSETSYESRRRREYTPEERAQAGEIIERRVTASRASDDRAAELRAEAWVRLLDPGPRADLSGDIESLAIRAVRAAEEKVKEQRRFSALFVPLDPRRDAA
jgi:hypothetical protein